MALLKFLQGNSSKLTGEVLKAAEEGWIYVTKDTGNMYIKTAASGSNGHIQLNAQYAYALRDESNSLFSVNQQTGTIGNQASLETGYPVTFSNGIPVAVKSVIEAEHADAADEAISATKLSRESPIQLSGDITGNADGIGDSSGWSINTSLSNTGVAAGEYGEGSVSYGDDGVAFPKISFKVDAKGRITSANEESIRINPVSTTQPGVMTATDKVKLDGIATGATANTGTITGISIGGTSIATKGVADIPAASTSVYGVTKLSSATDSTSTTLAATTSAVKAAYDLANTANAAANTATTTASAALPKAGGTMTGQLKLQSRVLTDSPTVGALDLNNSNIIGVNGIYTTGVSGINFKRTDTTADTLLAAGGVLYFTPNRTYGSSANGKTVIHTGNYQTLITPDKIGAATPAISETITLTASGWSSNNNTQIVSVSGWTSNTNGICSIAANQSASIVQMAQKSGIFILDDSITGKLVFSYFKSKPTSDIKMTIIMLG